MAKNININEEKLIETITQYLGRIRELNECRDQNNISIATDNLSLTQLLTLNENEHWNFIEEQVKNYMKNKEYEDALDEVNTALRYLQRKATWIISDNTPAFSNSATLYNFYANVPVVGGFFSGLSRSYHQAGMNKTKERLNQIDLWLTKLEKQLAPTVIDSIKNTLSMS